MTRWLTMVCAALLLGACASASGADGGPPVLGDDRDERGLVQGYAIVLDGFSPQEVARLEDRLTVLPGYRDHRLVETRHRFAELWYTSTIRSTTLNNGIRQAVDDAGLRATVTFSGNRLVVAKTGG